jgi:hypothetical protein
MGKRRMLSVTPSAARLTESLRDVGYDFPAAVADLMDNSVMAGAGRIDVLIEFDGPDSRVLVIDDGDGMSENGLVEALRFGTRRSYNRGDLGRYGLGLKTASLSQCRSLTVVTRSRAANGRRSERQLDLDVILDLDEWLVIDPLNRALVDRASRLLEESPGTVVIWEKLDRVLPEKSPAGGWARRRFESLSSKTAEHLSMVFHRYLSGLPGREPLIISVNGEKLRPWDPFASDEPATAQLPPHRYELVHGELTGAVTLKRSILPGRHRFSSAAEFDRLSGPLKWNRQQGLYVYRADRLVQWGGWAGIRAIDEHTKLARASLDFDTDLDTAFNINVAKMRVGVPPQLRQMLERPINELCIRAGNAYRKSHRSDRGSPRETREHTALNHDIGVAMRSAAIQAGEYAAFKKVARVLREMAPDIADELGL